MGSDGERDRFFRSILTLLKRHRVPFLVGGGYSFAVYTGIRRDTKDLDLFLTEEDTAKCLELARQAGFKCYVKSKHWLAKIERGEHFVDLIYSSGNGACPVDRAWFEHQRSSTLLGRQVGLVAPEEMIWSKAFVMERHRYDGADVAHLLLSQAPKLDWERLVDRFAEKWPVLLSHLILFRFIYPQKALAVPAYVMNTLLDRLVGAASGPGQAPSLCRGTLLSYCEYLPDVRQWGFRDARLRPTGTLSQAEIDVWTAERK